MSTDFSSSNPFRKKGPPPSSTSTSTLSNHTSLQPQSSSLSATSHIAYQHAGLQPAFSSISSHSSDAPKKIPKKVRVQSPPPPSPPTPSVPDSTSTAGDENYFLSAHPSTPPLRDPDPFEGLESASEDEDVKEAGPGKAPANPFSKTLETMEHPERDGPVIAQNTPTPSPGRASMDVEAFKRLLMTGNSGMGPSTPMAQSASQLHVAHALGGDGGSSTDTSSLSRQSIYEAIQEPHPESPRTSNEISEPDKERKAFSGKFTPPSPGKKPAPPPPPPPPSSRHGKMIRVELRDEPTALQVLQSPPTLGSITSHQYFSSAPQSQGHLTSSSQTDLNKPLPPAPNRTSHDSERESVFDKEAAGKTPEPPSPSSSIRRKTPPAPPLSRRHSQMVSESKLNRSGSGRLSPKAEEEIPEPRMSTIGTENTRPRSDSGRSAMSTVMGPVITRPRSNSGRTPPPPPSRRLGSIRKTSNPITANLTSPSTVSLPPPPPTRGASHTASRRPPSVRSMDMSSSNNASKNNNNSSGVSNRESKRASFMQPPPPPPPRHGRTSLDGQSPSTSGRTSGELPRQSIDSFRRGSAASSMLQHEVAKKEQEDENELENEALGIDADAAGGGSGAQRHDILADLSKLQREIDALRVHSEKEREIVT